MEIQEQLMESIQRADRLGARQALDAWVAIHGINRALTEVLEPVLLRVGEEWQVAGSVSIAQAYVAARIMEDLLLRIAAAKTAESPSEELKGPVILGNIEDDFHALGRKIVATFLRGDGWKVVDLGNDVPAADFVDSALEHQASVIGVSAMVYSTALNVRKVRDEIDRRGLAGKIKLAVGGAVFIARPGLVQEVGADGTARNAVEAARLFTELSATKTP